MQLRYGLHHFNGALEESKATEASFLEHQSETRQLLVTAIEATDTPHDTELFPERIILEGTYLAASIHQLMNKRIRPEPTTRPLGTMKGVQIELVKTGDYL